MTIEMYKENIFKTERKLTCSIAKQVNDMFIFIFKGGGLSAVKIKSSPLLNS